MKAICVDDEKELVEYTLSLCESLPQIEETRGFTKPAEALAYLETHPVDLALLDVHMPDMGGLEMAAQIRRRWPSTAVIFLTAHPEYAVDAFSVRASGYLIKPVSKERLCADVDYVLQARPAAKMPHILIRTFGSFDVFVDGNLVCFKAARCKELLAYLVDRQGGSVTRPEVFAILWEDRMYDRGMQKQLDVIIRSLRATLQEYGIEQIFEMKKGSMRIRPDTFTCDVYSFFAGDLDSINSFRGEYMSAYSWASLTESIMDGKWGPAD